MHCPLVDRGLFRVGQRDDERVAIGFCLELAAAPSRKGKDRLGHILRGLHGGIDPGRVADANTQLVRGAVQSPHAADLIAQVAQLVAQRLPKALEALGVDVGRLDLHENVRATAQIEAEVEKPGRQEAGPPGLLSLQFGREGRPAFHGDPGVIGLLDTAIKDVRQGDQNSCQTDQQDEDPLPGRKVQHLACSLPGPAPANGPGASGLGGVMPRQAQSCSAPARRWSARRAP